MDVLIVLATTIAYVYSVVVVIVNMIMKIPSPMAFFDVSPSKLRHIIYSLCVYFLFLFCITMTEKVLAVHMVTKIRD
jgi:hypothetical protein